MKDIPVVMFHSVNSDPLPHPMKPLMNTVTEFESYLKTFSALGYQMISMDDLLNGSYQKDRPFAVLTFDDGFRDNLRVALPLLKRFGARATIFVNPAFYSDVADEASAYGFLTRSEWKEAQESGVFDLQAHTMTHEFVFCSDKLVDVYTKERFSKYYWLSWMLFPESVHHWDSQAMSYADKIPEGYPIFEYTRRLSSPAFVPKKESVEAAIAAYLNGERDLEVLSSLASAEGYRESTEEFSAVIRTQLFECKKILEEATGKEVHTLCFPGGGYTEEVLAVAKEAGYRVYMRASRLKEGNNFAHTAALAAGEFVGLNRMSFSKIRKRFLPVGLTARFVSRVTLEAFQQKPFYCRLKRLLRKAR